MDGNDQPAGVGIVVQPSSLRLCAKRMEGDVKRPLIQNKEDVAEFVAKHMFERRPYYSEAKHRITGTSISVEELTALLN